MHEVVHFQLGDFEMSILLDGSRERPAKTLAVNAEDEIRP